MTSKIQKLLQPESKRSIRADLEKQMEEFLAKGGKIKICK